MDIDWSKAPDGCTHYDPNELPEDDNRWMKLKGGGLFTYDQGNWVLHSVNPDSHVASYIPRPKSHQTDTKGQESDGYVSAEWDGVGSFPMVHTDCEMADDKGQFVNVRIVSWIDGYTIGWCPDMEQVYFSKDPSDFRPIRTQAERDRQELQEIIDEAYESGIAVIAKEIIAAGWRKGAE